MTDANLLEIFCIFDGFCKYFVPKLKKHNLEVPGKHHRNRPCRVSDSEIMTILVLFHTRRFRDLKSFYLIETVNDELKNVCHIEQTRRRSVEKFVTNLLAGLIAYNLLPKKPSMNIDIIDKSRLIA